MTELRVLQPEDWTVWRDLRLQALQCDPSAFLTSLETVRQRAHDERFWRQRLSLDGSHNVAAVRDERPVGMVSAVLDRRGRAEVSSMWVTPSLRGTGVADALLTAVVSWARDVGSDEVLLDVHEENRRAQGIYRRHHFRVVGPSPEADGCLRMSRVP